MPYFAAGCWVTAESLWSSPRGKAVLGPHGCRTVRRRHGTSACPRPQISSSSGFVPKPWLPSTARAQRGWWDGSALITNKWNELNVIGDELFGARDPGMLSGLHTTLTTPPSSHRGRVFLPELRLNHCKDVSRVFVTHFVPKITQRQTCSPASFLR